MYKHKILYMENKHIELVTSPLQPVFSTCANGSC